MKKLLKWFWGFAAVWFFQLSLKYATRENLKIEEFERVLQRIHGGKFSIFEVKIMSGAEYIRCQNTGSWRKVGK